MELLKNRYVQLAMLTLGLGLLIWAVLWLILRALGLQDFPVILQLAIAFLGAGLIVTKYLSNRIF